MKWLFQPHTVVENKIYSCFSYTHKDFFKIIYNKKLSVHPSNRTLANFQKKILKKVNIKMKNML